MSDLHLHLPAETASASEARRFVESALAEVGVTPHPDIALLTSERVTNAVVHAHSPVDISLHIKGNAVCVRVHDESRDLPVPRDPSAMETSGRGLRIVEALADGWGVDVGNRGKVTWFETTW